MKKELYILGSGVHLGLLWEKAPQGWAKTESYILKSQMHKRTNVASLHLHEQPKTREYIETESRIAVPSGWEERGMKSSY